MHDDPLFAAAGEPIPPDQEARRRRRRLLNLLRGRWRWVAIGGAVLGVGLGTAGFFSQKTLYGSTGRIQMIQHLPDPTRNSGGWTTGEFLDTEIELIKSPAVISLAVQDEAWRRAAAEQADDASIIYSGIEVRRSAGNLVNITFVHENPDVAMAGLRAVMSSHKKAFASKYDKTEAEALRREQERRSQKERELVNRRQQRDTMTQNEGAENLDVPYNQLVNREGELAKALQQVRMTLISMGAALESGESPMASMSDEQLAEIDRVMADLFAMRSRLQFELNNYRNQNLGDRHLSVRKTQAELKTVEDQIAHQAGQLRQGLAAPRTNSGGSSLQNATIDELKNQESQLTQELNDVTARKIDVGKRNMAIKSINRDIDYLEEELREIEDRIDAMSLADIGEHIEVISNGGPGTPHNFETRIKRAVMGGLAGLCGAVGLVLLWGMVDRRFRHIDDAELDLPRVLGSLPSLPEKFDDNEQGVLVAHAVHHIRTLLQIGREDGGSVFSITSPIAGSGKTSLTMALGISYASAGARTLLIDCDVVGGGLTRRMNASAHARLGQILVRAGKIDQHAVEEALKAQQVSGKRIGEALVGLGYITREDLADALQEQQRTAVGLLEACAGEEFNACIFHTAIDNLDVLPIGNALPQHAGVLSPQSIKRLIAEARAAYDAVLLDTGPILGSIEASMAASEADGSILIIARGDKRILVERCVEHFRRVSGNLVGVVFNHALAQDIARSSYGSVTASQSRHPNQQALMDSLDADTSARYGPLATAVASFGAGSGRPAGHQPSHPRGNGHDSGN